MPQGYLFTYTQAVHNDIPLLYYSNTNWIFSRLNALRKYEHMAYNTLMPIPTTLSIGVFDDGVRCVMLSSGGLSTNTVMNKNVELMSFSEIQEIFKRYIVMTPNFGYDENRVMLDEGNSMPDTGVLDYNFDQLIKTRINIDEIRLGYMSIRERNTGDEILIPVWMFYGTQYDKLDKEKTEYVLDENNEKQMTTPAGHAFLVINAVTGAIIDPVKGY